MPVGQLREQNSNMHADITAYSQAVEMHSLTLADQQGVMEELKQADLKKDATIRELEGAKVKMAADIEDLLETVSRKDAKVDVLEQAQARMSAAIEKLERRMNELQQNSGT